MFSRRLIVFTLILLFFMLPGCGEVEETPGEEEKFSFVYNGVEIVPGEDIAPVLAALGEPTGYYEAASCAFEGLDKIYTYGGVQINTYPDGEVDRVLSVVLFDDACLTPEGVGIGSELKAVVAAYGEDYTGTENSITYTRGDTELKFLIKDGCVSSVQYHDIAARTG
ncbi:MAG TPA: hypothetical protein GX011_03440 [Clostridiales bacterium]|jgi:uncharacterized lipoprotein YehR (DUF1307 family)|nr:hypothetical protein [Clostridiales bacterium]